MRVAEHAAAFTVMTRRNLRAERDALPEESPMKRYLVNLRNAISTGLHDGAWSAPAWSRGVGYPKLISVERLAHLPR